jgi:phage shock protein PspC (stress-responsive transcriptional regulator)
MKKTISINISGIIFHIEEDGYEKLKNYLSGIGRYFATYEDSQEIIADIEARIAEIFLGKVNAGKQVITTEDVDTLIVTMGTTSDFEAVEAEESLYGRSRYAARSGGATAAATATLPPPVTTAPRKLFRDLNRKLVGGVASGIANYFRVDPLWIRLLFLATLLDLLALPGSLSGPTFIAYVILWLVVPGTYVSPEEDQKVKKLYRDPDTRVIGGVSAGIAAFFGIDATVVRLLFVLSIFFFGTGVLLYFILWAITPEARTLTERMRMQGEPVTLSNIEYNIKRGLREDDSREEGLLVRILLFPFRVIAAIFSAITRSLAPIALFLLEAIRVAAGLLLLVIAVSMFFGLLTLLGAGLGWINGYYGYVHLGGFPVDMLRESVPAATIIAGFFFALIPVIFVGHLGLILLTKRTLMRAPVGWTLFALWLLSVVGLSVTVPAAFANSRARSSFEETQQFPVIGGALYLDAQEAGHESYHQTHLYLEGYNGNGLNLVKRFYADGRNRQEARENAAMVSYNVQHNDTVLLFDQNFDFKPGAKFRDQALNLTLYIPYGQPFGMDESLGRILRDDQVPGLADDRRWVFTAGKGLECLNCPPESEPEDENEFSGYGSRSDLRDFQRMEVNGPFVVTVEGGSEYGVNVQADNDQRDDIEVEVEGERLRIRYRNDEFPDGFGDRNRIRISVTMPTPLRALDLSGAANATVRGFSDFDDMDVQLTGASTATVELAVNRIEADLAGASRLILNGRTNRLQAEVSGASQLDAFDLAAEEAVVNASGAGEANVQANRTLEADASSAGRIRYRGDANARVSSSTAGSVQREK